jgi:uncharacterized protein (TIGR03066 family)
MNRLLCFLCSLLTATAACAQLVKDKPAEAKPPAEAIVGTWHGNTGGFDEYMTFTADGRLILQRGPAETMSGTYKLDVASLPWKLDMAMKVKERDVTVYGLFDFPAPDQFRMAPPGPEEKLRPKAEALKNSQLVMTRISLGAHGGIYQVVEAHLKRLDGTWEGKSGKVSAAMTFKKDGTYSIRTDEFTDRGRFRIDVSKSPFALDLLSSEGLGPRCGIYEVSADGRLRISNGSRKAEDRPKDFESPGTQDFRKKETAPR